MLLLILLAIIASIVLVAATVKYPSISLVFLLTMGLLKGLLIREFRFSGFLDPIVLSGTWVAFAMMYNYVRTGTRIRDITSFPLTVFMILAALLMFGLSYTSAPKYGFEKSLRFATIVFVMFLAPVVLAQNIKDIKLIIVILFILGFMHAAGSIIAPHAAVFRIEGTSRAGFLETGPLRTAGMAAMGLIIVFCWAVTPRTYGKLKRLSIITAPIMLISMLMTGSRGPFFGLWLCVFTGLFVFRKNISKIWSIALVGATVALISVLFVFMPQETTDRIVGLVSGERSVEKVASARIDMFRWTWERAKDHPLLGYGTGAFAVGWSSKDVMDYPHNIFLELLYEQGWLGVALITVFIWLILRRWRQAVHLTRSLANPQTHMDALLLIHITGLLFLFNFLQAMKSFDINGNRLMFFSAGLVMAVFNCVRRMTEEAYIEDELMVDQWGQPNEGFLEDAQMSY